MYVSGAFRLLGSGPECRCVVPERAQARSELEHWVFTVYLGVGYVRENLEMSDCVYRVYSRLPLRTPSIVTSRRRLLW